MDLGASYRYLFECAKEMLCGCLGRKPLMGQAESQGEPLKLAAERRRLPGAHRTARVTGVRHLFGQG